MKVADKILRRAGSPRQGRRVGASTRDVQARERERAPRRGRPADPAPLMPPRDRFAQLDVLRGLAALVVIGAHYSSHGVRVDGFRHGLDLLYAFHAVELFFMLSGFAILLTLERSPDWRLFVFSRVTRLYPAYWAALTLTVVGQRVFFGYPVWLTGYVVNLTMLQEFLGFPNIDNVFWALTVQVAFYAIMGSVSAAGLLPHIERVAGGWLAAASLWALAQQRLGLQLPTLLDRLFVLRAAPYFILGLLAYRLVTRGVTPARLALGLAALAAAGWIDDYPGDGLAAVGAVDGLHRVGVATLLVSLVGLALAGKLRVITSPVTLWLGAISYSLYLSHRNLGYATIDRLHAAGLPAWAIMLLTVTGAVALGTALTYLVERPALRALRQWQPRQRAQPTGTAGAG